MIDLVSAVTAGTTAAGALRAFAALEGFFMRRSTNGNGNGKHAFTGADHDAILLNNVRLNDLAARNKEGFDLLHDDLQEVKQEIRDLRA